MLLDSVGEGTGMTSLCPTMSGGSAEKAETLGVTWWGAGIIWSVFSHMADVWYWFLAGTCLGLLTVTLPWGFSAGMVGLPPGVAASGIWTCDLGFRCDASPDQAEAVPSFMFFTQKAHRITPTTFFWLHGSHKSAQVQGKGN